MDERLDDVLESVNIDDTEDLSYDILTLISDDDEEYHFELLDRGELDGAEYVALVPVEGDEDGVSGDDDDEVSELVFMKAVVEGSEEFLESIEDDEEYERVSEYFTERLSELFDIE